jgi:hypothetical protein
MDGLRSNIQAEVNLALSPKASMSNGSGNFYFSFVLRNNRYSSRFCLPNDGSECWRYFFWFSLTENEEMFRLFFFKNHERLHKQILKKKKRKVA